MMVRKMNQKRYIATPAHPAHRNASYF